MNEMPKITTTEGMSKPTPILTGWVCPLCGRANAPWVTSCACVSAVPVAPQPYPYPWWPTSTHDPVTIYCGGGRSGGYGDRAGCPRRDLTRRALVIAWG